MGRDRMGGESMAHPTPATPTQTALASPFGRRGCVAAVCYNSCKSGITYRRQVMAKGKKQAKSLPSQRTERARLTAEESLKRLQEFAKRKEHFVAAVRKGKDRGVSA